MAKNKTFKAGLYGVVAGVVVAVILVALTIFAFTTRYTAFSPEKVAQVYADTIVQTGDGYNSQKQTLISKNQKHGNFIINAYMLSFVNDGDDVEKNELIGTGSKEETEILDKVYTTMYDYYCELIKTVGYDNYDKFYNDYFTKLKEVRQEVIGDEYMDTEFMFSVFESNVQSYANFLTGTEEKLAQDKKTVLQEKTTGKYQEVYGEDYHLTAAVTDTKMLDEAQTKDYVEAYKTRIAPVASQGEAKADQYGLVDKEKDTKKSNMISAFEKLDCSDSISAVAECTVEIKNKDTSVTTATIYVVKIGNSWYVDNTNIDTSVLYL